MRPAPHVFAILAVVFLAFAAFSADHTAEQHVPAADVPTTDADPWAPTEPHSTVTVTAGTRPRQTWQGTGCSSMARWTLRDRMLSAERRGRISDLLFTEAGMTTLRIWLVMSDYAPDQDTRRLDAAMPDSLADFIRAARTRGLRHLVLGPCGVPDWLRQRVAYTARDGTEKTRPELRDERAEDHAAVLAEFILECRQVHDIRFEATGIQNEPNTGNDCYFTPERMVTSVKRLRKALDVRGLQDVRIIAPETASCDGVAYEMVDALRADPSAWDALDGLATHSYNMAATPRLASVALEFGKSYWQTESSSPGPEEPGDAYRAAVLASTLLSDLNQAVTHWIYFIGAAPDDPRDNGTRVIAYKPDAGDADPDWVTVHRKHLSLVQLSRTFVPGAVLRSASSDAEGEMVWTYGRKPRIIAAVGRNPDGSWAVGISNFTYGAHPDTNSFQKDNAGYAAGTFTVNVVLPELAGVAAATFRVERSGRGDRIETGDRVTARNGRFSIEIGPLELVTLRSASVR